MEIPLAISYPLLAHDLYTLPGVWKLAPTLGVILCADIYYTKYRLPQKQPA